MIQLTPSEIIHYLFCPRFIYFEYLLKIPRYEDRHFKVVKGREIHEKKLIRNKEYLRKRIGVQEKYLDQYLTNDYLRGRIDEVLLLKDGTMAPLDYKFAQYKERLFSTYKTQLIAYAILIEENFGRPVNKGYLVYIRSKNKLLEVPISEEDKRRVKDVAMEINRIITENIYPKATRSKKKCVTCTYRNICTQ